ncbi:MAG: hypothetical protein GJ676_00575 [Rhodobacteraceae bacterium]|nr:hypothetical protein [Paracoccaceae bacterium]
MICDIKQAVAVLFTLLPLSAMAAPDYVGSETCAGCHVEETEAWTGSHHDLAWEEPSPDTILADFDHRSFDLDGVEIRFLTREDRFLVETDAPDGTVVSYPVVAVAGIEPLQQYIVETEPGRYQSLDAVWDTENERWYDLYPDQDIAAEDGLHWTGPYKNWNARCAECHATGYERNYDPATRQYSSTAAEIGVGCESCHGPGAAHLAWAQDGTEISDPALSSLGFTIDFSTTDQEVLIQQCAGCHSRREPLQDGSPLPGTPFHNAYRLSLLRAPLYHPDGQILDEVYVYGSFLQSKMYANGVSCSNCHDVHRAELIAQDNTVCTQCHSPAGNPDFPSLRLAEYDTPEHHFHVEQTEGAQCKSCHMIERNYMGIDGRRDHSFRVPRPDLTLQTGSPNACNDCHTDQTADWAASQIAQRFPDPTHRGPHFSQSFFAARQGDTSRVTELVEIALAEDRPAIIRASALELLTGMATPTVADSSAALLQDPHPLVREHAVVIQRQAAPEIRLTRLLPLLQDPIRSVRIAAAREMLTFDFAAIPQDQRFAFRGAMREWQGSLAAKADYPETHLVLGGIGLTTRNYRNAMSAFAEATRLDPQLVQAWVMQIRIADALGQSDLARNILLRANELNPDNQALVPFQSLLSQD